MRNCTSSVSSINLDIKAKNVSIVRNKNKQGRIHGYLSRVRVGRSGEKKLSVIDGQTDRQTDRAGCRVACTRLKIPDSSQK